MRYLVENTVEGFDANDTKGGKVLNRKEFDDFDEAKKFALDMANASYDKFKEDIFEYIVSDVVVFDQELSRAVYKIKTMKEYGDLEMTEYEDNIGREFSDEEYNLGANFIETTLKHDFFDSKYKVGDTYMIGNKKAVVDSIEKGSVYFKTDSGKRMRLKRKSAKDKDTVKDLKGLTRDELKKMFDDIIESVAVDCAGAYEMSQSDLEEAFDNYFNKFKPLAIQYLKETLEKENGVKFNK